MKRVFAGLLALILIFLSACSKEPEATVPSESTEPTIQQPTEPPKPQSAYDAYYEPYSTLEILTSGAVRKYPLEMEDAYAICSMGDGLLLFSGDEETKLTWLGTEGDTYSNILTGHFVYPDGQVTHIFDEEICYYSDSTNEVVYLDKTLQETARISLPMVIDGSVALSSNGEYIYYCDNTSVRSLELRTGISRMLKEMSPGQRDVIGLHFNDTVLECHMSSDVADEVLFISALTGQTLFASPEAADLRTNGDSYVARWMQGNITQWVFGTRGEKEKSLLLKNDQLIMHPAQGCSVVLTEKNDSTGTTLGYFDLSAGVRSASVRMAGLGHIWSITDKPIQGKIWFLATGTDADSPTVMYSWDPVLSPTGDSECYVSPYYTELEPDVQGLKEMEKQAKALAEKYGIRIRIWQDALEHIPSDYNFTDEYLVQAYERTLPVLETALTRFPDGFFKKLGSQSNNRVLTISLIRGAYGDNELGSLSEATGVHFWEDGNSYLALTMGDLFEQTFYHELFHSIDTYILTETVAFDFWDDLNPEGFRYDYSYVTNQYREDDQYLEEGSRAFIDMYSMSYPKEDRARIMEYAVMDGCAEYFTSDIMQAKLKTICKGIREAFGLKKDSRAFLWEQYLNEPLAYQK